MPDKKIHRKDRKYYQKQKTVTVYTGGSTTGGTDIDAPPPVDSDFEEYYAGEDLSDWIDEPVMIGTDGFAYKAQPEESNWNRVRGILVIPNVIYEIVRIRVRGIHESDNYDWSGSNYGDPLYVRNTGNSATPLTEIVGAEELHIHHLNVISPTSVRIVQPRYFLFK